MDSFAGQYALNSCSLKATAAMLANASCTVDWHLLPWVLGSNSHPLQLAELPRVNIMINTKTAFTWGLVSLATVVIIFAVNILVFIFMRNVYTITGVYVLIALMIALSIVLYYLRKRKKAEILTEEDEEAMDQVSGMPRKFFFKDLEAATENFKAKLGGGGFGSVFDGNLADGTRIAVKRLDPVSGQGRQEFLAEVKTIGSVHHFNLVRLLGFCAENYHKLLVYEYMCNGSLDKWIFHKNKDLTLDWPTRRKIILHIAKGLSYLHEECSRRIIHLDIKPQNVLLDGGFNAKLADFGLARFIDRDQSQVQTTIRGTRGYLAPEWFSNKGISEKVDVYSFGIVVLEIMCGRSNHDRLHTEDDESLLHLVKRKAEEDQLLDVVDKQCGDMIKDKEEAVKIIRLAIMCLRDDSKRRPFMSMVVKVLEDGVDIENIVNYSFLTMNPMELHEEVNASGSDPLLPEFLSGPR